LTRDLFEAPLTCDDLDGAVEFYRRIVGLRVAHETHAPRAAFFWIGSPGRAMLGLWAAGSAPPGITSDMALRVSLADLMRAPRALRAAGVTPLDFDGRPTDRPVVLAWMPAAAVYFRDPAGHLLEYLAMLPQEPRPEKGVVPWRKWELVSR
jgi:lactoylglutathione lyase